MLKFLHKATNHNDIQPMYPDRSMVTDPLVLLELGEARCGQVNRIAVDLWEAAGFQARLVQVAAHVSAEVFYDGGWHLCDGSIFFGNGEAPIKPDGTIPSVAELSDNPHLIDALTAFWEPRYENAINGNLNSPYPSVYFFSKEKYGSLKPAHYVKTATKEQAHRSKYYGWEHLRIVPDPDRRLHGGLRNRYIPRTGWEDIRVESTGQGRKVTLRSAPSVDLDGDLLGYKVMVSRQSGVGL